MLPSSSKQVSTTLEARELALLLEALSGVLTQLLGIQLLTATYGYGCYLHPDLWYKPMKVGTSWLDRFIRESQDQRIFVPCESDIYFEVPDKRLEIEFCHEGHIHLSGVDMELRAAFLQIAPFNQLSFT